MCIRDRATGLVPAALAIRSLRPEGTRVEQLLHLGSDARDEFVPVVERQPGSRYWWPDPDGDLHRADDRASLSHRIAPAAHGDGDDWGLRLNRHDEAALLERQQFTRPA